MQLKEAAKDVKLHGIKCYSIAARGIKYLAYSKEIKKLGVLRNDHSVEIWNLSNAPFLERTIPGSLENSVEVICWAGARLFTVGLSGDGLKEWDLKTLKPKRRLMLTGEQGICMDYHKATEKLVVGTEEGIINLFDLSNDDLQFDRILDRQDHRIICCKFNDEGDKLVSGSLDAVKVWSMNTGHAIHKMSTGRADPNQETIVWCIDILNDFTIISGDSRGKVTFWDGNLGSQIDYVQASNADVLCLGISEDRKTFFCSGVEQVIKKYTSVKINRAGNEVNQWVRSFKKSKVHTHDILSVLAIGNETFISGGVDGFLSIADQDIRHFERFGPFLKAPFAETAEESRLMLLKYTNYFEVWKLADGNEIEDESKEATDEDSLFSGDEGFPKILPKAKKENPRYRVDQQPEKLLELRSKSDEMIVSCAISNDGRWIAYSTLTSIRLFRFEVQENSRPEIKPIKATPEQFRPCLNMKFTKDSSSLITLKGDGHVSVFDLDVESIEHKETFDVSEHHTDAVHLMAISTCSTFMVFASLCNTITAWNLQKNKWTHSKTLPKHSCPATSLNIRRNQPTLVVSYSDSKLIEYNLDGNIIQFSATIPNKYANSQNAISDVCLDPQNQNAVIFVQNNAINVLEKDCEKPTNKKVKLAPKANGSTFNVTVAKEFNTHLIHLEFFGENELLALEVNPVALLENLPPPLRKKKFGLSA